MVLCIVNAGRCIWGNMGCVRRRHIVAWAVSEYILSSYTTPGLFMPSWQPQSSCWQVSAFSPSTAQRSTWKKLQSVPVTSYFHCSQSHVFLASATMTSADGLHNAWNPDITQDPERVLRLHTLLIYRHGGELWITGDRSPVPCHMGRLSGWRWMTHQKTWQYFGLYQGSEKSAPVLLCSIMCQ